MALVTTQVWLFQGGWRGSTARATEVRPKDGFLARYRRKAIGKWEKDIKKLEARDTTESDRSFQQTSKKPHLSLGN